MWLYIYMAVYINNFEYYDNMIYEDQVKNFIEIKSIGYTKE